MTDPDSSIISNTMEEWFRNNKDVQHVMTRRHAVFAKKAIRFCKNKMNQKGEQGGEALDRIPH